MATFSSGEAIEGAVPQPASNRRRAGELAREQSQPESSASVSQYAYKSTKTSNSWASLEAAQTPKKSLVQQAQDKLLRMTDVQDDDTLTRFTTGITGELPGTPRSLSHRVVHSTAFGLLIAVVILSNAVQIGFETEYPDDPHWSIMELVFLAVYVVELGLRLFADGLLNFGDKWFIFDAAVVSLSLADKIGLMSLLSGSLGVLRVARLSKVVRIVRLFRFFSELHLLVTSMTAAFKTVLWMWVLLAIVIYMFGVLFCNELGHMFPDDEHVQYWWGSVGRSCFTLFTVLTLEGWEDKARHCWHSAPQMVVLLIVFISLTTYAIVNVVVAVIVQHVVDSAMQRKDDQLKRMESEVEERTRELANMFQKADIDGDYRLSLDELRLAVQDRDVQRRLRLMDLEFDDLSSLFTQIDINGSGDLSLHEFVNGILQMRGPARARRVFELHCDFVRHQAHTTDQFRKLHAHISRQEESLAGLRESIDKLTSRLLFEAPREITAQAVSQVAEESHALPQVECMPPAKPKTDGQIQLDAPFVCQRVRFSACSATSNSALAKSWENALDAIESLACMTLSAGATNPLPPSPRPSPLLAASRNQLLAREGDTRRSSSSPTTCGPQDADATHIAALEQDLCVRKEEFLRGATSPKKTSICSKSRCVCTL